MVDNILFHCIGCQPGFYQELSGKKFCDSCPAGFFQSISNKSYCIPCMPGNYQFKISSIKCESCSPGKFQALPGSYSCNKCPRGFYQNLNMTSYCIPCLPGKYENEISQSKFCKDCPIGYYQGSSNSLECNLVLPGSITIKSKVAGQTSIIPCNPGQYGQGCKYCPSGYVRTSGISGLERLSRSPVGDRFLNSQHTHKTPLFTTHTFFSHTIQPHKPFLLTL